MSYDIIYIYTMVQYNQYVDPSTDAMIEKLATQKKEREKLRYVSKTDIVLEILQKEAKKYLK